jgi:hypothetical protein
MRSRSSALATFALLAALAAATLLVPGRDHGSTTALVAAVSRKLESRGVAGRGSRPPATADASVVPTREQAGDVAASGGVRFVTGSVLSALGLAVAGASVEARADEVVRVTKTGPNGKFQLELPDSRVELRIEHPEFFGIGRSLSRGQRHLHVRLTALGVIFGSVPGMLSTGSRHLALEVSAGDDMGPWRALVPHVPIDNGEFRIAVRTTRFVRLVVIGSNGAEAVSEPQVVEPGANCGPVRLRPAGG